MSEIHRCRDTWMYCDGNCTNCTLIKNGTIGDKLVVDDAQTFEVVPVVRCKDCRWKELEEPGMVYCPAVVGGWVDEDWFCKGGERSEE